MVVEQGLIFKLSFLNKNNFNFSIDNFIKLLIEYHHPALEPLIIDEKGSITIQTDYSLNPDNIYLLFYIHGFVIKSKMLIKFID